jgi:NAD+ kinase
VNTIAVIAKRDKPEAVSLAQQLKSRYPQLKFVAEIQLAQALGWPTVNEESELGAIADLVIVLGGDGTLIHASRLLRGGAVPILGINLGSLGFMTEVPSGEMLPMVDEVLAGNFRIDSRMKLRCRIFRGGEVHLEDEVLNDVVINKGALARIGDHEMLMNGQYVTTFKSDGVIVATPTGSTAYSMSAGGPIVHPSMDAMIVAPICPHALTQRPIVVPGDQSISIDLKSDVPDFYLTIDGQTGHRLKKGDRLDVHKSPNRVLLVRNPRLDYFSILRQKLRWGER